MKNLFQQLLVLFICFFLFTSVEAAQGSHARFNIIDTHEHIQDSNQAYKYNQAIKKHNIKSIILVASPKEVLVETDAKEMGFTKAEWNNNELLKICKQHPDKYFAFAYIFISSSITSCNFFFFTKSFLIFFIKPSSVKIYLKVYSKTLNLSCQYITFLK